MRSVIAILLLFFVQVKVSVSMTFDTTFRVQKDTNLIFVQINDDVDDGCWTNILESKKYAEEKLVLLGANITNDIDYVPLDFKKNIHFPLLCRVEG